MSLYNLQFGFKFIQHSWFKMSTNSALMSITGNIQSPLDFGKYTEGVFVDFRKPFYTADRVILLKKLEHYGVRWIPNRVFRAYLTERTQFISVANHASSTRELHWHTTKFNSDHLLFLLYMNELHKCLKNCKAYLFADGTNLNVTSKYLQTLAKKLYNKNYIMI